MRHMLKPPMNTCTYSLVLHSLVECRENLSEAGLGSSLVNHILTGQVDVITAPVEEQHSDVIVLQPRYARMA